MSKESKRIKKQKEQQDRRGKLGPSIHVKLPAWARSIVENNRVIKHKPK